MCDSAIHPAPKVRKVCAYCGSENVYLDAMAEWDVDRQEWVLSHLFDDASCAGCDGETSLSDRPASTIWVVA